MGELQICVCVKSIPDPRQAAEATLDPKTGLMRRSADALGIPRVIGPLDRCALEEALRIKEAQGAQVTAMTMDTPAAIAALREALAMGADQAILLSDRALAGADSLATARTLAAGIGRLGACDLVLCGARSYHGSTGQVGPQLAELLGVAHVSFAVELRFTGPRQVQVRSELERRFAVTAAGLPLLITVTEAINRPRHVSLMGIVQARRKEIVQWGIAELGLAPEEAGLAGSPSRVGGVAMLPMERKGEVLPGDGEQAVAALVGRLREAAVL